MTETARQSLAKAFGEVEKALTGLENMAQYRFWEADKRAMVNFKVRNILEGGLKENADMKKIIEEAIEVLKPFTMQGNGA